MKESPTERKVHDQTCLNCLKCKRWRIGKTITLRGLNLKTMSKLVTIKEYADKHYLSGGKKKKVNRQYIYYLIRVGKLKCEEIGDHKFVRVK